MTFFNFNSLKVPKVPTRFNLLLETTKLKQFIFIFIIKRVDTKNVIKITVKQTIIYSYVSKHSKLLQFPNLN